MRWVERCDRYLRLHSLYNATHSAGNQQLYEMKQQQLMYKLEEGRTQHNTVSELKAFFF